MKHTVFIAFLIIVVFMMTACTDPLYKDASAPVERRVKDLLKRMTLEEKIAQLDMLNASSILESANVLSEAKMDSFLRNNTIGSIHDFYPTAEVSNQIQRFVQENSRLGIPPLIIEEALHGYQGPNATLFPIPICYASSWDTTLIYNIGRVTGTEARAHGVHLVFAPNLDLAREPRWGRVEETYGEDTYLSSRLAVNMVKGMQGHSLKDPDAVMAEPKHFGIHGIPQNGSNTSPVDIGEREARTSHLYVFEKAIKEGGARAVMAAYHEIDGIPVTANKWLLTKVLRDEWGMDGFVISDLGAIIMQCYRHTTAATAEDAIVNALNAGVNMQFYDYPHDVYKQNILNAVKKGRVKESTINKLVSEILRYKFELGLFDNPYIDTTLVAKSYHSDAHKQLAYQAAISSIVLLKNDHETLPFKKDIKRIAVIGELANTGLAGGYSTKGTHVTSVLEALQKRFGNDVQIDYLNGNISSHTSSIPTSNLKRIRGTGNGVNVDFFNNLDLSGEPVYSSVEPTFYQYWHNLSPAPGVHAKPFSIKASATLHVDVSGLYDFELVADNYGRLLLDGKLLIDNWDDKYINVTRHAQAYLESGKEYPISTELAKVDNFAGQRLKWHYIGGNAMTELNRKTASEAAKADIVVVVIGENADEVGEGLDRADIRIRDVDAELVKAAVSSGKPVVTVLLNGRPLILESIKDICPAIVEAWIPGEFSGDAIVDVLFGDVNPSGKLTISFPRCMGQLPIYYNHKPSATRSYIDEEAAPAYPFGYGLSYTTFEYSNLKITPERPTIGSNITVSLDVKNTGKVAGTEVVQLYINDVVSSVSTPVKSLKGFSRITLNVGEKQRVEMVLTPEHLSLLNIDMKRVVEAGEFDIMVGSSSEDIRLQSRINVLE